MISELARLFLYTILIPRLPSVLFLLSESVCVCVLSNTHTAHYSAAGEIIKNVPAVEGERDDGGVAEGQKPDGFLRLFS